MDQIKVGSFIKELRKVKNLTQEQLAEAFNVSRRTVSRWETGSNLPDLDILIEMSDFFEVDLREILDGERRSKEMNEEMKETVLKVAEYSNEEKKKIAGITLACFIIGIISFVVNQLMIFFDLPSTFWVGFFEGVTGGITLAAMIIGILFITGAMAKVRGFKMRMLGRK